MSIDENDTEGWSIDCSLYAFIRKVLSDGSTILELGSGYGTSQLAKYYTMISVEHDMKFLDKYDSTYLWVPLKEHKEIKNHPTTCWYDAEVLKHKLFGFKYALLLIDGPPQTRSGFFKYFDIFDESVIMVFDDLHRDCERKVINSIASKLKCPYVVYGSGDGKSFGVINDPYLKV